MEIPKKVKIAGIVYTVEEVKGMADNEGLLGRIVHEAGSMYLDKDMSQERKEQVFVHEVLHGIFKEAGYEEHDEDLINRVAIVLHQVLKDNDFSAKGESIVLSGSVNCSECGADWSAGEICPHIHGPLELISGGDPFIQVLESPETKWGRPSPMSYKIAPELVKNQNNERKGIK